MECIREDILTVDNVQRLIAMTNAAAVEKQSHADERLAAIERERSVLSGRLERLHDAVEGGHLTLDDLASRITELRTRVAVLDAEQQQLEAESESAEPIEMSREQVETLLEDLLTVAHTDDTAVMRELLALLVEQITVHEDHIQLVYSIPLPPPESMEPPRDGSHRGPEEFVMSLAEGEGFEPPVPVKAQRFSRPSP